MTAIMRHFRTVLANERAMRAASEDAREVIRRVEEELRGKREDSERAGYKVKTIESGHVVIRRA